MRTTDLLHIDVCMFFKGFHPMYKITTNPNQQSHRNIITLLRVQCVPAAILCELVCELADLQNSKATSCCFGRSGFACEHDFGSFRQDSFPDEYAYIVHLAIYDSQQSRTNHVLRRSR